MSYRDMQKRLAALEQEAEAKHRAWMESLSDAELEELCKDAPPEVEAAARAMSDDELERALDGRMSEAEYEQHIERAWKRINGSVL